MRILHRRFQVVNNSVRNQLEFVLRKHLKILRRYVVLRRREIRPFWSNWANPFIPCTLEKVISRYSVSLSDAAAYYSETLSNESNRNLNLPLDELRFSWDDTRLTSQLISAPSSGPSNASRRGSFSD